METNALCRTVTLLVVAGLSSGCSATDGEASGEAPPPISITSGRLYVFPESGDAMVTMRIKASVATEITEIEAEGLKAAFSLPAVPSETVAGPDLTSATGSPAVVLGETTQTIPLPAEQEVHIGPGGYGAVLDEFGAVLTEDEVRLTVMTAGGGHLDLTLPVIIEGSSAFGTAGPE